MPTPTRSTHTPGPWKVDAAGCPASDGLPCVSGSNNALLAMMAHSGDKGLANAALIAAAPDLLALVRRWRNYAERTEDTSSVCVSLEDDTNALLTRIGGAK